MRNSILLLLLLALGLGLQAQNPPTEYAVQLAAFNQPVPLDYFEGFEDVYFMSVYGGTMFKYFTRTYKSKDKAMQVAEQARQAGHAHAKVIDMGRYRQILATCCAAPNETAPISVNNIFFDFDQSNLRPASRAELDRVVRILRDNPSYTVEVRAHTDAKGSDAYNQALSARRRDAALNYLKSKGISEGRITSSIHGENEPAAINATASGGDSPQGRQLNRRVELIIRDPQGGVKAADRDFVPRELKPNR